MKQSAVEWLIDNLHYFRLQPKWNDIVEQAKEMEKQQIKDAYITGMFNAHSKTSIDYYDETFKNK